MKRVISLPFQVAGRQGRTFIRVCTGASMATYDEMSPVARQQLMQALRSLSGLREGPKGTFPDGTHYEYDPDLKGTVEVTPSGDRFPVALVRGELKRDSENVVARKGEAA